MPNNNALWLPSFHRPDGGIITQNHLRTLQDMRLGQPAMQSLRDWIRDGLLHDVMVEPGPLRAWIKERRLHTFTHEFLREIYGAKVVADLCRKAPYTLQRQVIIEEED